MKQTAAIVASAIATAMALTGCVPPQSSTAQRTPSPGGHGYVSGGAAGGALYSTQRDPNARDRGPTGEGMGGDDDGHGGFGESGSGHSGG